MVHSVGIRNKRTEAKGTTMTTETIERDEDWTRCICGNEPAFDGFYCSDADGTIRENGYGPEAEWDEVHMSCFSCGRVFVFETGQVVGRMSAEMLAGALAYVA